MAVRGNSSAAPAAFDAAEITSIIPIDWDFAEWNDAPVDAPHDPTPTRSTPRRAPLPAEVTQDILIAEYEFDETAHEHPFAVRGAEFDDFDFVPGPTPAPRKSGGRHRIAAPPHALKGRAALLAVAAGAAVVAATGQLQSGSATETNQSAEPATDAVSPAAAVGPVAPSAGDAGVVESAPPSDMRNFTDQLQAGDKLARDAAAADAASRKPLFASPVNMGAYQFTSCFCGRWGTFHGGIDFAAPLGTPIHAATDGEIVEAGPASGFGNWIQVKSADGTITMYGHMASSGVLVSKGQKVTAGDIIGLVGNEGFSTGPHVHVEVWKNGTTKIDPMPWFAEHGVRLSAYTG
ncbi:M23 family metallopeptidase [Williamsia maris]|uniref:M23 family metallopeptidase n=1 Tax=Williamsia maris TaxID=72806 RepID=UPI0020A5D6B1|nr:M23 family metallopeptidase [Williamsia maris]